MKFGVVGELPPMILPCLLPLPPPAPTGGVIIGPGFLEMEARVGVLEAGVVGAGAAAADDDVVAAWLAKGSAEAAKGSALLLLPPLLPRSPNASNPPPLPLAGVLKIAATEEEEEPEAAVGAPNGSLLKSPPLPPLPPWLLLALLLLNASKPPPPVVLELSTPVLFPNGWTGVWLEDSSKGSNDPPAPPALNPLPAGVSAEGPVGDWKQPRGTGAPPALNLLSPVLAKGSLEKVLLLFPILDGREPLPLPSPLPPPPR
mmetsp:Transcript_23796/g.39727  ORF Transcript_23796/g.39727 Transcript_23796/m.39727 type:complete len:258 (+) Transcript_23796:1055-1828(+)